MAIFFGVIYLLFFLSGATALVYQVVWVRSLTLVFGGSHLAVTAVLSIFMGGLALGGFLVGRRVDRVARPLRLYGLLEIGIAVSALLVAAVMKSYPSIYITLAQGRDESTVYLTAVRMVFSIVVLIVPTVLMGGTLPVLSRFVARQPEQLRNHLSFLYGFNTLGAVAGALVAGFVFLRAYSVSTTLFIAVATNLLVGLASLALQRRLDLAPAAGPEPDAPASAGIPDLTPSELLSVRLVVWGIGISGFCALGYEVLWTRVLTVAVGASVYGFTIILVAFLTGIALGSKAYGALARILGQEVPPTRRIVTAFGLTQLAIGITALLATVFLRDVPANAVRLQAYFSGGAPALFAARAWGNFTLAFLHMLVPALFMGAAFPIAGEAVARYRRATGQAVGETLAANTVGAILGAAVSGLILIRLVGIERSLQMLTVLNIGTGLLVLASLGRRRWVLAATAAATAGVVLFLGVNRDALRIWDRKYFAIFRSNQPEAFRTAEMVREAIENTDVLYYGEGVESIVSVIRVKGGEQAFLTNGRVEASSHLQAQQVQFTLGHLPMLLARNPKDVLVVGMGSGMTAGATAVHPSTERVTLVEIEPQVSGVARAFDQYNHHVLDHPKVKVVFNDGRNFLLTTRQTFDVITADPIHPWFRGAGYLYAEEYFALAAQHLRPGGVIAQWLPIYELTRQDLASVVRTFQQRVPYTLLFLTHYDAVIVGSNAPFVLDEAELQRRISAPEVSADLSRVMMGSSTDLLSYFVMGTEGMRRFAREGTLNTDDRLYLEFSAPFSIAAAGVMADNVAALTAGRENLLGYVVPAEHPIAREEQVERWNRQFAAARIGDAALATFLGGNTGDPAMVGRLRQLAVEYPAYAPGRFLAAEQQSVASLEPRLLDRSSFSLMDERGDITSFELSAVLVPVSRTRASIMFVDNRARVVYGQRYVDDSDAGSLARRLAGEVMAEVQAVYEKQSAAARARKRALPASGETLEQIRAVIAAKVQGVQPRS